MPDPIVWSLAWPYFLAAWLFGYLLGSMPFGYLITRFAGMGDVRLTGSGSTGATNVLRTGNKKLAALTLLGDVAKGSIAVLVAAEWGPDQAVMAAFGALVGHLFPVWLRFAGGKGVATYLGILLALCWLAPALLPALAFAGVWLVIAALFRFSSLASILAMIAVPAVMWWLRLAQEAELMAMLSLLSIARHHQNIGRLFKGTESKIGSKD